jgi:hypothetical protein
MAAATRLCHHRSIGQDGELLQRALPPILFPLSLQGVSYVMNDLRRIVML